jgi:hypothetical protein
VEEASRSISETQKHLDEKLDGIYKILQQWGSPSEMGSAEKPSRTSPVPPRPPPPYPNTLTPDEMAFLRKQEAAGKISLHPDPFTTSSAFTSASSSSDALTFTISNPHQHTNHGIIYTHYPLILINQTNRHKPHQILLALHNHQPIPTHNLISVPFQTIPSPNSPTKHLIYTETTIPSSTFQ